MNYTKTVQILLEKIIKQEQGTLTSISSGFCGMTKTQFSELQEILNNLNMNVNTNNIRVFKS